MHNGVAAIDLFRQRGEVQNIALRVADAVDIAFRRQINDMDIPAIARKPLADGLSDMPEPASDEYAHPLSLAS